jgi:hypothetical protein
MMSTSAEAAAAICSGVTADATEALRRKLQLPMLLLHLLLLLAILLDPASPSACCY